MPARESQLNGRSRLRDLRAHNRETAEQMARERERFRALAEPGAAPVAVASFNLFQTPGPICRRMADMLGERANILEPSAGLGRLYLASRMHNDTPSTLVDISAECCTQLEKIAAGDQGAKVVQGDFLALTVADLGTFDGVIMNPPFKRGTDIHHIKHAAKFLTDGGLLVALCANGPRQREALLPIVETWEELPAGSFRSEGTGVDVALLTIR